MTVLAIGILDSIIKSIYESEKESREFYAAQNEVLPRLDKKSDKKMEDWLEELHKCGICDDEMRYYGLEDQKIKFYIQDKLPEEVENIMKIRLAINENVQSNYMRIIDELNASSPSYQKDTYTPNIPTKDDISSMFKEGLLSNTTKETERKSIKEARQNFGYFGGSEEKLRQWVEEYPHGSRIIAPEAYFSQILEKCMDCTMWEEAREYTRGMLLCYHNGRLPNKEEGFVRTSLSRSGKIQNLYEDLRFDLLSSLASKVGEY